MIAFDPSAEGGDSSEGRGDDLGVVGQRYTKLKGLTVVGQPLDGSAGTCLGRADSLRMHRPDQIRTWSTAPEYGVQAQHYDILSSQTGPRTGRIRICLSVKCFRNQTDVQLDSLQVSLA